MIINVFRLGANCPESGGYLSVGRNVRIPFATVGYCLFYFEWLLEKPFCDGENSFP